MKKMRWVWGIALTTILWISCVHDPVIPNPPDPVEISFKNHIQPFLLSTCALPGCHTGANPAGEVNLTSYELVIETAEVKAGDPDGSDLYERITEDSPSKVMPPGSPLPPAQIETVRLWIAQGAKNN